MVPKGALICWGRAGNTSVSDEVNARGSRDTHRWERITGLSGCVIAGTSRSMPCDSTIPSRSSLADVESPGDSEEESIVIHELPRFHHLQSIATSEDKGRRFKAVIKAYVASRACAGECNAMERSGEQPRAGDNSCAAMGIEQEDVEAEAEVGISISTCVRLPAGGKYNRLCGSGLASPRLDNHRSSANGKNGGARTSQDLACGPNSRGKRKRDEAF